ncbi:MAG: hypothetical protein ACPG5W_03605 [Flavobacteriales bacterium]
MAKTKPAATTEEPQESGPAKVPVLMVYVGVAIDKDDKRVQVWLPVTAEEFDTGKLDDAWRERRRAYATLDEKGRPGTAFMFSQEQDTNTVDTPGEFYGEWKDETLRTVWQTEHDYNLAQLDKLSQKRSAGKRNTLYEMLAPVREVYEQTPQGQRNVFLVRLTEYITKGEKS